VSTSSFFIPFSSLGTSHCVKISHLCCGQLRNF